MNAVPKQIRGGNVCVCICIYVFSHRNIGKVSVQRCSGFLGSLSEREKRERGRPFIAAIRK